MKFLIRSATMASVLALGAFGANAADLTVEPAPIAPVAEAFNWTGFYVGVHGGIGAGDFDHHLSISEVGGPGYEDIGTVTTDAGGGFGGAQVGYNYEFSNHVVLGAEADIAAAAIDGKVSFDGSDFIPVNIEAGTSVDWFGTVRARLGYAFDNVLVYGTGGFAYGDVKTTLNGNLDGQGFDYSYSDTQTGWTVGAGVEYGITKNITLKAEYLYVDLGSSTITEQVSEDTNFNVDVDTAFHTLKAGLNYKF
jgi:outer membrane immunogenic protein